MKKLVAVMLVVVAVLSASCAFADDGEKMTFNDMKFSKNYIRLKAMRQLTC